MVDPLLGLLVVADGVGGQDGGEVASCLAVDAIEDEIRRSDGARDPAIGFGQWPYGYDRTLSANGNRLRTAVLAAHMRLLDASLGDVHLSGMATTVAAALIADGRLAVAWVGDSRLYLLCSEGLRRLTEDDSWPGSMHGTEGGPLGGTLTAPRPGGLTNAVGCRSGVDVHVLETTVVPGDVVALVTDGIHGVLDDRCLARLLSRRLSPAHAAADLVAAAIGSGSADNCTAVVALV